MESSQYKSRIAAHNNADLCAAIMAANGIRTVRDNAAYFCLDDPLPFYPKLVTLDPTANDAIGERCRGISGIKDSFSCLDTDALGLKVAFDASWIWHDAGQRDLPDKWVHITEADALSDWHQAWQGEGSLSNQVIFPSECLKNPNLTFFARLSGTAIQAGCLANLSGDVVGMSNVFSTIPNDKHLYDEALSAVATVGDGCPVVGYEHGADLVAASLAGFQPVGPLRVLIR